MPLGHWDLGLQVCIWKELNVAVPSGFAFDRLFSKLSCRDLSQHSLRIMEMFGAKL